MIETRSVIASDGVATAVRIAGTRGPALVFIHGVGSTAAIWDSQLNALSDEYRCYAIELRGNGVPKPDPDPATIDRVGYARDVLSIIDAFGVEQFCIIGCSLGGVVAFELWQHVSARISALAIVGSFARYPDADAYVERVTTAVKQAGTMRAFAQERAAALGLPSGRLHETIEQMACKEVASYLAATRATWTGNYCALLPSITAPTWVTLGERDTVAPLVLSREIAEAVPGSEFSVIPGAGHVANADAADAFNASLRAFLTRAMGIDSM